MTKILSYQGIITKQEFLNELKKHEEADNFIKGTYWKKEQQKGCTVGCSLESIARIKKLNINYSDHSQYQELLGIPEWLAKVEDAIFEGLSKEQSRTWPYNFAKEIPENIDLDQIKHPFLICVLKKVLNTFNHKKYSNIKKSIDKVIHLYQINGTDEQLMYAHMITCYNVAVTINIAHSAPYSAARSVHSAAEHLLINTAINIADTVTYAAIATAYSTNSNFISYSAAYTAAYEYFSNQLLEMLKNAK